MLTIGLDHTKKEPFYRQIYAYIRDEIRSGALPCGSKLPSTRRLAKHMDLSRNTIDLAYGQLTAEGYIEAKPKCGYFVCQVEDLASLNIPVETEEEDPVQEEEPIPFDFSPVGVDMSLFPYNVWRRLLKEVMMNDNSELFQKGENQGDLGLRRAIMYYLRQSRGVHVGTSQIVIGAGIENLLFLLSLTLGKGRTMAMENPAYLNAYQTVRELGFQVLPINMDEEGLKVSQLEQSGADLAYVTPARQYPTGVVLPIGRRSRLIKWAREKKERYIIEDDYDSEFRYASRPIPALGELDRAGRVVYVNTFAKSLAPGLRISYLVLPDALMARYRAQFSLYSSTVPSFDQHTLAAFMRTGGFERHISRSRKVYQARRDALMAALDRELAGLPHEVSRSEAGLHLLLHMRSGMLEGELINRARAVGVRVYGLSAYYTPPVKPPRATLVLGYAGLTERQIDEAAALLRQAWDGR